MSPCYIYHVEVTDEGKKIHVHVRDPEGIERNPTGSCKLYEIPARISELVTKTQRGKATTTEMEELGEILFNSLFSEEIATDFRNLLAKVSDEDIDETQEEIADDISLRLVLDFDEKELPALAALPWEFLRAPQTAGREGINLGTHSKIALCRRRKLWDYAAPIARTKPLRIQLVISDPKDSNLGPVAYKEVETALKKLAEDNSNQIAPPLKTLFNPSLSSINDILENSKPDILHFIGHGQLRRSARGIGFGELALVGPAGTAEWCNAKQIGELFEERKPAIVILQACKSGAEGVYEAFVGVASQVVHRKVPVVVAMQYPINNNAAVTFAEEFYRRIGQFKPVDVAVQRGRRLLRQKFAKTRDFATPLLFMRVEGGQLFIKKKEMRRIQIYLQGDFSALSGERRSAAIEAFAAVMDISPKEINVFRVYEGSIVFDIGVPPGGIERLRSLLQSNSDKIHQLKIEKIRLEIEKGALGKERAELRMGKPALARYLDEPVLSMEDADVYEEWINKKGTFCISPGIPRKSIQPFNEEMINTYPFPIAQACADFNQASERGRRFIVFDRLITLLIKFLTAIFIGQSRHDTPPDYPLPDRLDWMTRPILENWTEALSELSQIYTGSPWREKCKLEGLLDSFTQPLTGKPELSAAIEYMASQLNHKGSISPSVIEFIRLLAKFCVREWKEGAAYYPLEKIAPVISLLQPALVVVLNQLKPIKKYPLIYVERADEVGNDLHLRIVKFMGTSTEDLTPYHNKPLVVPRIEARHIKRRRFYLAEDDGIPILDLHPFFVLFRWEMYQLEHRVEGYIEYISCNRGTKFRPPPDAESYIATWWKDPTNTEPIEVVPPILGKDEHWDDKIELIPSNETMESIPLTWLNPEGRQALEIALGEALRIGHFWLGIEFLLMGLSKQKEKSFPKLLREMGIHPAEFRGMIRGIVDVAKEQDWQELDAETLGAEALPRVRTLDHHKLIRDFKSNRPISPVITPRVLNVLQEAAKLAGESQVGHNQLLWAAFRHHRSLAIRLFFSLVYKVGFPPDKVMARLADLVGTDPKHLMEDRPEGAGDLQPPRDLPIDREPRLKRKSILDKFGRDLNQAALDGKLHQAEGEKARQAMAQIGRILLQREANNPILVGDPGVGKTAIVEGFAWRLAGQGKKIVEKLTGKRVVELSTTALTAGTKYRGDLEERLQQLVNEVKTAKGQLIVFIDEIHNILGGGASNGLNAIADAFKPALARGEFPCIGATTVNEYRRHIEKDSALSRRFTPVWIEEPGIEEAIQVVKKVAQEHLAKHHGVSFMPQAIEAAVKLSVRYLHDKRLPGKAINILDEACSHLIIVGSLSGQPDDHQEASGGIVTVEAVVKVIANRTNIPVEQIAKSEKQRFLDLEGKLKKRVIGQNEAIEQVVRIIKRAGAGLTDPRRPLGVFLFCGPTGVGKTELVLSLAEALFDREDNMLRLDMSEFMEEYKVSRLIGAPPGYVGFEVEGQLTGHLRRRPYSVVLLDEIEKTHKNVQHIFLQLFDNGRLTDAQGRLADGRNAIFIMTTNLGAKEALVFIDEPQNYLEKFKASIDRHFTLEFINRIDRIVYFAPLDENALVAIFDREFATFQERLHTEKELELTVSQKVKQQIARHAAKQQMGARPLRRLIEDQIITPVVDKLLKGEYKPGDRVTIDQEMELDIKKAPPHQIDLSKLKLDDLELPKVPEVSKIKPPTSPEKGLPHLDDIAAEIQKPFDERFLILSKKLWEQGITLEITGFAKNFLCAPYNQTLRGDRSPVKAFEDLIETPLTDKLLAEEFNNGDWVRIDKKFDDIIFEKMGGTVT